MHPSFVVYQQRTKEHLAWLQVQRKMMSNIFTLVFLVATLFHLCQSSVCVPHPKIPFEVGTRLASAEMHTIKTYTAYQCYDQCYRTERCQGFTFEQDFGAPIGKRHSCTLCYGAVSTLGPLPLCNNVKCFTAGRKSSV